MAWRRGTALDSLLPAMTFFQAAPYFFIAIVLVAVFATKLGWFPAINAYDQTLVTPGWNWGYISNVLDHAFLPALTIVLASAAGWIVGMRNVMVTTMDEDYVLVAQAEGTAQAPRRQLRGAERDPAERHRFLTGHRLRGLRRAADRDRLLLSGHRLHPAAGRRSSATTRCCRGCSSSSRSRC